MADTTAHSTAADHLNPAPELLDALRHGLVGELQLALPEVSMDSSTLACLWSADLTKLESFVTRAQHGGEDAAYISLFLSSNSCTIALKTLAAITSSSTRFSQAETFVRERSASVSSLSSQESDVRETWEHVRSSSAEADAIIDLVPIYPVSDLSSRSNLWTTLSLFWSEDKIDAWKTATSDAEAMESCANRMSMINMVHGLWSRALFGLKPVSVSDDGKMLKCQSYWLQASPYKRDLSFFPPPVLPGGLDGSRPKEGKLWDMVTERKICSGDYLEFHTDDPEERPLPSFHLLHMRWVMNRVLAMSGVIEVDDET